VPGVVLAGIALTPPDGSREAREPTRRAAETRSGSIARRPKEGECLPGLYMKPTWRYGCDTRGCFGSTMGGGDTLDTWASKPPLSRGHRWVGSSRGFVLASQSPVKQLPSRKS
jgi:hypothetical protein